MRSESMELQVWNADLTFSLVYTLGEAYNTVGRCRSYLKHRGGASTNRSAGPDDNVGQLTLTLISCFDDARSVCCSRQRYWLLALVPCGSAFWFNVRLNIRNWTKLIWIISDYSWLGHNWYLLFAHCGVF